MTAAARGNVPVAVFNATLSSLIGIFLTPLWIGLVIGTSGGSLPLGKVDSRFGVVAFAAAHCRPTRRARFWARGRNRTNRSSTTSIKPRFCCWFTPRFAIRSWTACGRKTAPAFCCPHLSARFCFASSCSPRFSICAKSKIAPADSAAVIFCGTKKTLASGVPMAHLIFGANPGLGLILLPILIYHPLQLAICGWLASRWARRADMREAALAASAV